MKIGAGKKKAYYDVISNGIYLAVYKIGIDEHLVFFKRNFKVFVVRFLTTEGKLLNEKHYPIKGIGLMLASKRNIGLTCERLRLPTTWGEERGNLRTYTYCADPVEQQYFHKVLYRHFKKLNFLQNKWKKWNLYFFSCTGQYKAEYTISLKNE